MTENNERRKPQQSGRHIYGRKLIQQFFKNRAGFISGVRASIHDSSARRTLYHDATFINFLSENYDALSILRRRDEQSRATELRNVAPNTAESDFKDINGTEYFVSL